MVAERRGRLAQAISTHQQASALSMAAVEAAREVAGQQQAEVDVLNEQLAGDQ